METKTKKAIIYNSVIFDLIGIFYTYNYNNNLVLTFAPITAKLNDTHRIIPTIGPNEEKYCNLHVKVPTSWSYDCYSRISIGNVY